MITPGFRAQIKHIPGGIGSIVADHTTMIEAIRWLLQWPGAVEAHITPIAAIEIKALAQFDANLSPNAEINKRAAQERGLRYDPQKRAYTDAEGALVYDRFGQPF